MGAAQSSLGGNTTILSVVREICCLSGFTASLLCGAMVRFRSVGFDVFRVALTVGQPTSADK